MLELLNKNNRFPYPKNRKILSRIFKMIEFPATRYLFGFREISRMHSNDLFLHYKTAILNLSVNFKQRV